MEKKLQKLSLTYCNFMIAQDLCQVHYQSFSIIFLEKLKKLNGNKDTTIKKCETQAYRYKYCNSFLEYTDFKDDLIEQNCLRFSENFQQKFDEKLKKLKSLPENGTSLLEKEDFYRHIIMEDFTDTDYLHSKRVCKYLKIKKIKRIS